MIPQSLQREVGLDTILDRLPKAYTIATLSAHFASQFVYQQGLAKLPVSQKVHILFTPDQIDEMDRFDRVQLADVLSVCQQATTDGDELLVHPCDMDKALFGKKTIFDFKKHRRTEHYQRIVNQTGVIYPDGTPG